MPGLALAVVLAAAAFALASVLPPTVSPVLIAVVAGIALGNLVRLPEGVAPGLRIAASTVLKLGVVLLGARLTLVDVIEVGGPSLALVVVTMTAALTVVAVLGRWAGLSGTVTALLGVGTAVCGNSAIMATAPVLRARDRDVGVAVATITLFGTLALLLLPTLGHLAELPDRVLGLWVGLAVNDTSQVVAAAAAYSEEALDVAVVVKLVRNALMAPLILVIAWVAARRRAAEAGAGRAVRGAVPLFVLGFLALVALRSVGLLGDVHGEALGRAATVLITVAIAAVGLRVRIVDLRRAGLRPVLVGLGAATTLTVVAFVAARLVGTT